jgi:hypothetical protein
MLTSAVEIGAFDDGNKLFMAVADYNSQNYINLFCGVDRNCVIRNTCIDNAACVQQYRMDDGNIYKYWIVQKNCTLGQDTKPSKTIHPYWLEINTKPF